MPELSALNERLAGLIKTREEDRGREDEFRREIKEKLEEILEQTSATNGRVNAHDVSLALLAELPKRVAKLEDLSQRLRDLENQRKGAKATIVAIWTVCGVGVGGLVTWILGR